MPMIIRICEKCKDEFEIERWRLKNPNRGRFCSRVCKNRYYSGEKSHYFGTNKTGENSPSWKGENVGYFGLHTWVNKVLGKPQKCEICGKDHLTGLYIDWANKDHKYKRVTTDWLRLCRSCHRYYDQKFNGYKKGVKNA